MRVSLLMENTARPGFEAAHGLSIFIESGGRRWLFDAGPDDAFLRNAHRLGVDLGTAEAAFLSHGHYDHGGGLGAFLAANKKAPVYVRAGALGEIYARAGKGWRYIGLDRALRDEARMVEVAADADLGPGLRLLALGARAGSLFDSSTRAGMAIKSGEDFVPDRFDHEQSLVVEENGRLVLFCGCAHGGIVETLETARQRCGRPVDVVFGGFHLHNPSTGKPEKAQTLAAIAERLADWPTQYYTFHCTGQAAFDDLRARLGPRIEALSAGDVVEV